MKPKEIQAWAVVDRDGSILEDYLNGGDNVMQIYSSKNKAFESAKGWNNYHGVNSLRSIKVTIKPTTK